MEVYKLPSSILHPTLSGVSLSIAIHPFDVYSCSFASLFSVFLQDFKLWLDSCCTLMTLLYYILIYSYYASVDWQKGLPHKVDIRCSNRVSRYGACTCGSLKTVIPNQRCIWASRSRKNKCMKLLFVTGYYGIASPDIASLYRGCDLWVKESRSGPLRNLPVSVRVFGQYPSLHKFNDLCSTCIFWSLIRKNVFN